jgi:hypothetical protein
MTYCVGFQIEDYDAAATATVCDETAPYLRSDRYTMRSRLSWYVSEHFARIGIDNHSVRRSRNKQPVCFGIDCQIVPSSISTDMKRLRDCPIYLRYGR